MPTGPGGLDANGVWQYGEDDTEALASDLLNLGMASVSTEVGLLDAAVAAIVTGQILQVVSTTKTDTYSAALNASFSSNVTGLEVDITPLSASSRMMVSFTLTGANGTGSRAELYARLMRDSTAIAIGGAASSRPLVTSAAYAPTAANSAATATISGQTLDSPATTSEITYGVQLYAPDAQTVSVNRSAGDNDNAYGSRLVSTLTVMEVAG